MFLIDRVLVSGRLFTTFFHCDPAFCGGACCVEGEGRVPLDRPEVEALSAREEEITAALDETGAALVKRRGTAISYPGRGFRAPLRPGGACVYARRSRQGGAFWCLLEDLSPPAKPLSCRLYPVRISRRGPFEMLLYHRWDVCAGAEDFGRRLETRLFRFVREGLIARYGAGFYNRLEEQARLILPDR